MNTFTITEKLPSLNEYTSKERTNRFAGAKFKRDVQKLIADYINEAKERGELTPIETPVVVQFEWYEKTKRRDADNIASAKKFILDALVEQHILIDDSRKYVRGFQDTIINAKENKVIVTFLEVK